MQGSDQEIVGCGSSGSQDQSDRDTGQEGYGGSSAAAELPGVTDLRGGWGCQGAGGAGRGLGGLGFSGEMPGFLSPGCGVSSHTPVTPCPNLIVLGGHLDDVLLSSIGIRDGVGCAIRELHMLPLVQDERPVAQKKLERKGFGIRPS